MSETWRRFRVAAARTTLVWTLASGLVLAEVIPEDNAAKTLTTPCGESAAAVPGDGSFPVPVACVTVDSPLPVEPGRPIPLPPPIVLPDPTHDNSELTPWEFVLDLVVAILF